MPYSPGGYSWIGLSPEPKNVPMTEKEKAQLESDIDSMQSAAIQLESKINRYQKLCKRYEVHAGTEKGAEIYHELDGLKKEIEYLSKEISHSLDDTADITHLND